MGEVATPDRDGGGGGGGGGGGRAGGGGGYGGGGLAGAGFEAIWAQLAPIGRARDGAGYFRRPFGAAERECAAWFVEQCGARGLEVEADGNGNLIGWLGVGSDRRGAASTGASAVLTGSHLDSVPAGGAYDGPLGVVSALAAIDILRAEGFVPARPIGIATFAEEEGSRFGLACLGSRLATGAITAEAAAQLADRDGVRLPEAMAAAGVEPRLGRSTWVDRVGAFAELHVEQGRQLVDRGAAVGLASLIWPHGRWLFEFTGQADHAGSTRMQDRRDPMLAYAMTVLAANKQARLSGDRQARATFGRVEVTPNATNAVPSRVRGWLDARAPDAGTLDELVAAIERLAADRAGRDGTAVRVTAESVTGPVGLDRELTDRLAARLAGRLAPGDPDHVHPVDGHRAAVPVIASQAGHDAGVLAAAGIPSAMLFVRNPTGVSHAPAESAEMADCLAGVQALAETLRELAS